MARRKKPEPTKESPQVPRAQQDKQQQEQLAALELANANHEATQARLAVLEEELIATREENAKLTATIASLSKDRLERIPKAQAQLPDPFTIDGDTYAFRMPAVFFEGKKVTAAEVRDNTELALRLVAAGSGMLTTL